MGWSELTNSVGYACQYVGRRGAARAQPRLQSVFRRPLLCATPRVGSGEHDGELWRRACGKLMNGFFNATADGRWP